MSVFSFDEAVAGSTEADLQRVAADLQASLDDLGGFVSRVRSAWEGDEQESYTGIQQKWDTSAAVIQEILNAVKAALGTTTSSVGEMRGKVRSSLQA